MQDKKKIVILIILAIIAVFVWIPKGKRGPTPPKPTAISLERPIPKVTPGKRKRSKFVDWGANPFIWQREVAEAVVDLSLSGIIWDEADSYAIINGEVVHVGDKIGDKTVQRIEPNKVILSDEFTDYTLELE